ncbi:Hypothetical predicted protein, partial [Xyrichtys novacula]
EVSGVQSTLPADASMAVPPCESESIDKTCQRPPIALCRQHQQAKPSGATLPAHPNLPGNRG